MVSYTAKFTWRAGRWVGITTKIRNKAHLLGLGLKVEVDKGIFFETGRGSVTGDFAIVRNFEKWLRGWSGS